MGFFSNLFKKKQDKQPEIVVEQKQEVESNDGPICDYCKRSIFGQQKVKTFDNKKYHVKPCWFALRKDALAYATGQVKVSN